MGMYEEFALLEAFIAFVGFLMTLRHFSGAMRYLSMALLSDAVSNVLYVVLSDSDVFTVNSFVMCAMVLCFCLQIRKRRRLL